MLKSTAGILAHLAAGLEQVFPIEGVVNMSFFKRFLRSKKSVAKRHAVRLILETLEDRDNPSFGFGGGFGAHEFALGAAHFDAFRGGDDYSTESTQTTLTAILTGATGTSGSVTFTSDTNTETNSLSVQVSGLAANTEFTVLSGSNTLGTITTSASGSGSLSASNISSTLSSGAAITVTDPSNATVLSGTLATPSGGGEDGGECQHSNPQTLSATLTGATGTSGTATFTIYTDTGTNKLNVHVAGLTASTTYTVMSGTSKLGTITTDASGAGTLTASDIAASLETGSTISIVDSTSATVLSGTLAASKSAITHLTSSLTGTTGSGTLNYTANANTGTNSLSVSVAGLTPSTNYSVDSGTNTLGTISTNSSGSGTLLVSNVSPALASGGSVSVVDPGNTTVLAGTLATGTTSASTGTHVTASLTGTTGSGRAHFNAKASTGNNRFGLSVTGLTASANYTVQVGGTTLGTLTTNANGSGHLSLSDITASIASGTTVTVLDSTGATVLSGTFADAVTHHHDRGGWWWTVNG
jgi:hypothetical protein